MRGQTRLASLKIALGCGLAAAALISSSVDAASPLPPFIPATADWLTTVNYYRAMAGEGPVVANAVWSAGDESHSCYMLYNGMSHPETAGLTGSTPEGNLAGMNGNVAVSSVIGTSARSHIELWMSSPFHAIGVLRYNLQSTGFGKCDLPGTPTWHSGATLDVLRGLNSSLPRPTEPILFPGNGTTTNLNRFIVETPDPLSFCPGWSAPAGLPIIAMMPEAATGPTATLSGPSGLLEVCVLSAANTTSTAQAILNGDNAVVVVPRSPLAPGAYNVTVDTTARDVPWSFTVDPAASAGAAPAPVPVAQATGPATGFAPLPPARIVDTRIQLGTSRLNGQNAPHILITGTGGVPAGANAVLANVTVTGPSGSGFLTMWNCSATRPDVSTLNFSVNQTVANAATIPLDSGGGLCAFSNVATDLVIDVSGFYSSSATGRYMPVVPDRLLDSRAGTRLVGGTPIELKVVGVAGVPPNATAVALNVTGIFPSADGFVTAYPCGAMPPTSSLNPATGRVTPNLVMAPVSSNGTVCFFSNADVDLVVDVVGYVSAAPAATTMLTPSTPFRFTDTRDPSRLPVNAGQNGVRLTASQTITVQMAGVRGISPTAKAISANLTVVDATAAGFLTAFPCGGEIPTASNVNYVVGAAIANAAELPLSATGAICIYSSGSAQVIIDVNGWWS